jgi:hypothetical protein
LSNIGEQGTELKQHAHAAAQGVQFISTESRYRLTVD